MISKRKIALTILSLWLFVYIFQLPLSRISMLYISNGVALLLIIPYSRYIRVIDNIVRIIIGFVPFFLYFIITMSAHVLNNGFKEVYKQNILYVFIYSIAILIAVSFLLTVLKEKVYTKDEFVKCFITVTFMQLLCVISSLLFPNIKDFFNSFIIKNSHSEAVVNATKAFGNYRAYGLADNLFDQFGYIIALLITISFAYGLFNKKKKIVFLSIIFLVIPLVNARSGLLLSLIGITIVSLYYIIREGFSKIYRLLLILLILVLFASFLLQYISNDTYEWIMTGYDELFVLFSKGDTSGKTITALLSDMVWPDDVIFGAGGAPNGFGYKGIDMGYIRLVWMFGIVGSILLFVGYLNLFVVTYRNTYCEYGKAIIIAMSSLFFVYLFKLFPIYVTGGNMILFGCPIVLMVTTQCECISEK